MDEIISWFQKVFSPPKLLDFPRNGEFSALSYGLESLDEVLLGSSWVELQPFLAALDLCDQKLSSLKSLGMECRTNGIGLTATQSVRVTRLCDVIDSLAKWQWRMTLTADLSPVTITSSLPDYDTVQTYLTKIRAKLRLIEEMASSKKNEGIRFRPTTSTNTPKTTKRIFDLSAIRAQVIDLLESIDAIEQSLQVPTVNSCLTLFSELKQSIHKAVQETVHNLQALPSLQTIEDALTIQMETLKQHEAQYNEARKADRLVRMARTRREMIAIEDVIRDLWTRACASTHFMDILKDNTGNVSVDASIFFSDDDQAQHLISRLLEHQRDGILSNVLDAELLQAYWQDWKEREDWIEECIRSQECKTAYSRLQEARRRLHRSRQAALVQWEEYKAAVENWSAGRLRAANTVQLAAQTLQSSCPGGPSIQFSVK
eukprot:gene6632-7325_t